MSPAAGTSKYARFGTGVCAVYQLCDEDGVVIYVGATVHIRTRFYNHARSKEWWCEVAIESVTVEWFDTAHDASVRESDLISELQPKYNRSGVTRQYARYSGPRAPSPPRATPSKSSRVEAAANRLRSYRGRDASSGIAGLMLAAAIKAGWREGFSMQTIAALLGVSVDEVIKRR